MHYNIHRYYCLGDGEESLRAELWTQLKIGVPIVISTLLNFSLTLISLGFIGRSGNTDDLAAAGLALALWKITGRK